MNDQDTIKIVNALLGQLNSLRSEVRRNAGYLARQEINEILAAVRLNPKALAAYGYKVYSQNDEDGIIEEIFKRIGIDKGTFCEIGVENGLECNTLFLLHKGWKGLWLEGDQQQFQPIAQKFRQLIHGGRLALEICRVDPLNVNDVIVQSLQKIDVSVDSLDFLSIDIDGMDIYLLEALAFKPKVICIEYNAKFPAHVKKKPVYSDTYGWTGTDYMGSSLAAINEVAVAKGYSLAATNLVGANAFFVRTDLLNDKFDNQTTVETLYNPPRYHLFFDYYSNGIGHPPDFGPYCDLD